MLKWATTHTHNMPFLNIIIPSDESIPIYFSYKLPYRKIVRFMNSSTYMTTGEKKIGDGMGLGGDIKHHNKPKDNNILNKSISGEFICLCSSKISVKTIRKIVFLLVCMEEHEEGAKMYYICECLYSCFGFGFKTYRSRGWCCCIVCWWNKTMCHIPVG